MHMIHKNHNTDDTYEESGEYPSWVRDMYG